MRGFGVHVQKAAHLPGLLVSAVVSGHSWNGQRPDPVMVVRDCERHTADFQLDKLDIAQVRDALLPLIDRESVLCPDGAAGESLAHPECQCLSQQIKGGMATHAGALSTDHRATHCLREALGRFGKFGKHVIGT
jgi:hypothetical protein